MSDLIENEKSRSTELIFGSLIAFSAIVHIPSKLFVGTSDRNAAPQFIVVALLGLFCAYYLFRTRRIELTPVIALSTLILLIATLVSLLLSDNFFTGLIGDTGRFAGLASLWSLLLVALTASTFTPKQFFSTLQGIVIGAFVVTFLGAMQSLNLINLPTGGGVGSTFGNLDFLAASIGTTMVLVYIVFKKFKFSRIFFLAYLLVSVLTLVKIDAKQGWLDLGIAAIAVALFKAAKLLKFPELSALTWKAIATFGILLWSEIIFLVPMSKVKIWGISNDPNVSIRSDFWFAATQMFRNHFGFGVGPDNYGNYYEKYRSLHSVKNFETVLANDAHSSMLQTMATLGIFATLAFLVLILFVIYSFIDSYKATKSNIYLLLLLSFFIFYTNSLISPIPLPLKVIFWAIAGFAIGSVRHTAIEKSGSLIFVGTRITAGLLAAALLFALYSFVPSFIKVDSALGQINSGKSIHYTVSDTLPCVIYSSTQLNLVERSQGNTVIAASKILRNNPRCLDALGYLANVALHNRDYRSAKPFIYELLDIAPARKSVVRLAAIYAMGAGDENLKNLLTSQGLKLGILTQSQIK